MRLRVKIYEANENDFDFPKNLSAKIMRFIDANDIYDYKIMCSELKIIISLI